LLIGQQIKVAGDEEKEKARKGEGRKGGVMEDCLSFVLPLVCFAHCDLPVRQQI